MVLVLVIVIVCGALLAPGLLVGPSLDAAVFSHVGGRLLEGVAPYSGAWDHKPPGIYLADGLAQLLLGWLGPWTASWLLSLVVTAGIGIVVAAILSRIGVKSWPRVLAAVGATVLASQYLLALGGGLTEGPATLLVGGALLLALAPSGLRAAALGGLVGLGILLSLQLAPGGLLVIGLLLVLAPAGSMLRLSAAAAIGFVVPLALATAWLAAIGALPAAVDAVVGYSGAYRFSSARYGAILGAPVASWTVLASLFLVAPALLGAGGLRRFPQPARSVALISLLWLAASLVLFVAQGRFYAHYAIPLAVPLGILAGLGLHRARQAFARGIGASRRLVIGLPLVVSLAVSVVASVPSAAMEMSPVAADQARIEAVAERLADLPAGSLLVWGNAPRLYEVANRAPAMRFSYLYPLTTPGYSTAAMAEEVAHDLVDDPPVVVVDAGSSAPGQPGFLPLLIERPVATDGRDLDLLDPLRAVVADRYDLVDTVAGWPIYLLRGASAS